MAQNFLYDPATDTEVFTRLSAFDIGFEAPPSQELVDAFVRLAVDESKGAPLAQPSVPRVESFFRTSSGATFVGTTLCPIGQPLNRTWDLRYSLDVREWTAVVDRLVGYRAHGNPDLYQSIAWHALADNHYTPLDHFCGKLIGPFLYALKKTMENYSLYVWPPCSCRLMQEIQSAGYSAHSDQPIQFKKVVKLALEKGYIHPDIRELLRFGHFEDEEVTRINAIDDLVVQEMNDQTLQGQLVYLADRAKRAVDPILNRSRRLFKSAIVHPSQDPRQGPGLQGSGHQTPSVRAYSLAQYF